MSPWYVLIIKHRDNFTVITHYNTILHTNILATLIQVLYAYFFSFKPTVLMNGYLYETFACSHPPNPNTFLKTRDFMRANMDIMPWKAIILVIVTLVLPT
jgi:hypothetical protein